MMRDLLKPRLDLLSELEKNPKEYSIGDFRVKAGVDYLSGKYFEDNDGLIICVFKLTKTKSNLFERVSYLIFYEEYKRFILDFYTLNIALPKAQREFFYDRAVLTDTIENENTDKYRYFIYVDSLKNKDRAKAITLFNNYYQILHTLLSRDSYIDFNGINLYSDLEKLAKELPQGHKFHCLNDIKPKALNI